MNGLKQLISDGEQPSAMRVAFLILVACVIPPVMVVWVILSLRQNAFIVPPTGFITLISVAFGTKSLQSFAENFSAGKASGAAESQPQGKTSNIQQPTSNNQ